MDNSSRSFLKHTLILIGFIRNHNIHIQYFCLLKLQRKLNVVNIIVTIRREKNQVKIHHKLHYIINIY